MKRQKETEKERNRERERERDRQTDRQTDSQTDRQTDRQTETEGIFFFFCYHISRITYFDIAISKILSDMKLMNEMSEI